MTGPLLQWVLERYPDTPKSRAKQWILAGRVSVRGEVIRKPHQLMVDPGDGLELGGREASTLALGTGWQIHPRVKLVHLDSSLAVVDKGAGIISVPGATDAISALSVLADFLAGRLKPRDRELAMKTLPAPYRNLEPLPVHRLDQYTTGLFCLAMNPAAREKLIDQLQAGEIRREYIAFAEGRPGESKGSWKNWLQLSRDELRQNIVPGPGGDAVEAVTHYEVVAEYPIKEGNAFITELRLQLETGRKHQIRAQAAHAGLPLVGDRAYTPDPVVEFPRQALHACRLSLDHPAQKRRLEWTSRLPDDLRRLQIALKEGKPTLCQSTSGPPKPRELK